MKKNEFKEKATLIVDGLPIAMANVFEMKVRPIPKGWPNELTFNLTLENGKELIYDGKLRKKTTPVKD